MQIIGIVQTFFTLYSFILLARVLIGWFQVDPYNPLVQALYTLTEPLLAPIRRILPPSGPLDFSPIVAFILLRVVEMIVVALLASAVR
jgi:YggT family protein